MENKPVNIFWTGGWDSTFRVLQLVIEEKRKVQPHFVVRAQASVGKEIKTMIDIRRELFRNYPETRGLLKPTFYADILGIENNSQITDSVNKIRRRYDFSGQYDFCGRYCAQHDILDMEISLTKDGRVQKIIDPYLSGDHWRMNPNKSGEEKLFFDVFKYYKFPLVNTSKVEMKMIAKRGGWDNLLEMTWFCATPYKGKPCGFCGPCTYVIEEGIGRRLPIFRRLLSTIHLPFRRFYRDKIKL